MKKPHCGCCAAVASGMGKVRANEEPPGIGILRRLASFYSYVRGGYFPSGSRLCGGFFRKRLPVLA